MDVRSNTDQTGLTASDFGTSTVRKPTRVAVLLGGTSAERAISLQSGNAVAAALGQRGHHVTLIDPQETDLRVVTWSQFDVVFLALHGTFGEDGQAQSILEAAGVPFTGSDAVASRTAFSKSAAKIAFAAQGVATPNYLVQRCDAATLPDLNSASLRLPVVVKPDANGSSLGVTLVRQLDEFPAAIAACRSLGESVLIEQAVLGAEWTVPILGSQLLPAIRIDSPRVLFDFTAKYEEETTFVFDPPVSKPMRALINRAAREAYAAVGAAGLARVDMRLDESGLPSVLEVNTIPGLTDHSLTPKSAAWAGISLGELCELCLTDALERFANRRNLRVA